jgi:hypothetical protein
LNHPDNDLSSSTFTTTGPSGIQVMIEFLPDTIYYDDQTTTTTRTVVQNVVANVLREITGTKRLWTVDFGNCYQQQQSSSSHAHHHHRCTLEKKTRPPHPQRKNNNNNNNHHHHERVTDDYYYFTVWHPDFHASFGNTEHLRMFTHDWGMLSSSNSANALTELSRWMQGGNGIPIALEEVAPALATEEEFDGDDQRRVIVHHPRIYREWRLVETPNDPSTPSQHSQQIEQIRRLEYIVRGSSSSSSSIRKDSNQKQQQQYLDISLQDILPPLWTDSSASLLKPHKLTDVATLKVIGATNERRFDDTIVLGPACQPKNEQQQQQEIMTWNLTDTCFYWKPHRPSVQSKTTTTLSSSYSSSVIWTVRSTLLRPSGPAYRGTWQAQIRNAHDSCAVVLFELIQTLPHVLQPLWRTLQVQVISSDDKNSNNALPPKITVDFFDDGSHRLFVHPSKRYVLPPQSSLRISLDYDPAFLSVDDFPADANRGFEIPPMTVTFLPDSSSCLPPLWLSQDPVTLYSHELLLLAPLPDMSMPYNVLSLSCTLYAFVVGSLMNLLIKKASNQLKAKIDPDSVEPDGLLAKIVSKIRNRIRRYRTKPSIQTDSESPNGAAAGNATVSSPPLEDHDASRSNDEGTEPRSSQKQNIEG